MLPFLLACTGMLLILEHSGEEHGLHAALGFGFGLAAALWIFRTELGELCAELGTAPAAAVCAALLAALREHRIDVVVLAGFLSILGPSVITAYPERILNVHPSLIPSFCGAGYYGLRVHEAALAKGVKVTGATVHFVNEVPDGGRILLQQAVDVLPGDTPETLQKRVMEQAEWKLLPEAAQRVASSLERSGKQ